MSTESPKKLIDVEAALIYLSISRSLLYKLVKSKEIPSVKYGDRRLFDITDLDKSIESRKQT